MIQLSEVWEAEEFVAINVCKYNHTNKQIYIYRVSKIYILFIHNSNSLCNNKNNKYGEQNEYVIVIYILFIHNSISLCYNKNNKYGEQNEYAIVLLSTE